MAKNIDWLYTRKSCVTCQRAQAHMENAESKVKEAVNGLKIKYGPEDALKLLDGIDTLVAMKGAKVNTFDLKNDRPADDVLLAFLIGPTGNMRAPTALVGKTMLVGFNEETYRKYLGG